MMMMMIMIIIIIIIIINAALEICLGGSILHFEMCSELSAALQCFYHLHFIYVYIFISYKNLLYSVQSTAEVKN
jgi:hypothetical protein